MDITPGKTVSVEVLTPPTTATARKTLLRVLSKDPQVAHYQRRQTKKRPSWQTWRRGGRMWHHQMKSKSPVRLTPGSRYSLLATVDVIRDLESVQRWVKVSPQ